MNDFVLDLFVLIGIVAVATLIFIFIKKRKIKYGLLAVLALGVSLRVYLASEPQLHDWDERFHALVAKNLTKHPLKPTLYDDAVLPTNEMEWSSSHLWFSKPPVPLWLMAGSISVFGNSIWAVRLPSILLAMLAIYMTFLIGKKLFDEQTGLIAAFLHAINGLIIELAAGKVSSDHVESCFIICVEIAVYFILVSDRSQKGIRYVALAGVFTGLAFLSKWFPAMIVFPLWFVHYLSKNGFKWKDLFIQGFVLVACSVLVVLPWIIQINSFEDNILERVLFAFSEPIQNHAEPIYFYWHQIMIIFGELVYLPLILAAYWLIKKKENNYWVLLMWILIPLLIFTLGGTKRHTYILIASPAFFVVIASVISWMKDRYSDRKSLIGSWFVIVLLIGLPVRYAAERLKLFQDKDEISPFYQNLADHPTEFGPNDVVFGVEESIELMYFTDVAAAYQYLPGPMAYRIAKDKGYQIWYYQDGKFEQANQAPQ